MATHQMLELNHLHVLQRCVELLNSVRDVSTRGQLVCCRATLLLADTACIRGTPYATIIATTPSSNDADSAATMKAEQMVEIFQGLITNIKAQVCMTVNVNNIKYYA